MKVRIIGTAIVAGTVGYVLGTRAGRSRYRELRRGARRAWKNPAVRKAAKQAKKSVAHATGRR